jgi:hypothetical protein
MTPQELAAALQDELQDALTDLTTSRSLRVDSVLPPADLEAGSSLLVTISSDAGTSLAVELPSTLAIGYLADEEAAVDEWKGWVNRLSKRLHDTPHGNP